MDDEESPRPRVQSLPSDYTDVQPDSYDPEFISQINSKMQVPYNLVEGVRGENRGVSTPDLTAFTDMRVPDRILVAGEGKHLGGRHGFQELDFDKTSSYTPYVGLRTPPRTLTMEETINFPMLDEKQEVERQLQQNVSQNHSSHRFVPNGELNSRQPIPFIPGDSINDSLLMNDLDENTQLKNAVAKLTRRVQDLEDNDKTRSYILYPTVLVLSLKLLYDVFIKSK